MSLEQALADNTKAIITLIAALGASGFVKTAGPTGADAPVLGNQQLAPAKSAQQAADALFNVAATDAKPAPAGKPQLAPAPAPAEPTGGTSSSQTLTREQILEAIKTHVNAGRREPVVKAVKAAGVKNAAALDDVTLKAVLEDLEALEAVS